MMSQITLHHKNLWIVPTSSGVWLLFFWFILLLASVNYQNNLGFIMVFVIAVVGVLSILMSFFNLKQRTFQLQREQWLFANQRSQLEIYSKAPKKTYRMGWSIAGEQGLCPTLEDEALKLPFTPKARGKQRLPHIELGSLFPFGWLHARLRWQIEESVLVFPEPIIGPKQQAFTESEIGGGQPEPHYPREYTPGDPLKNIQWKRAHPHKPLSVLSTSTQDSEELLSYKAYPGVPFETMLSYLTAAVLAHHQGHEAFALELPSITLGPDQGLDFTRECLHALAIEAG